MTEINLASKQGSVSSLRESLLHSLPPGITGGHGNLIHSSKQIHLQISNYKIAPYIAEWSPMNFE